MSTSAPISTSVPTRKKVTTLTFRQKKERGEPITMLTAYDYPTAIDKDNVSTYLLPENFNRYFTRGVEAWAKWQVFKDFEWFPSVTYLNGRTSATYNWLNTGANGQGADVFAHDLRELLRAS